MILSYFRSLQNCTYEKKGDELILSHRISQKFTPQTYIFTLADGSYVFNAEKSSDPPFTNDSPYMSYALPAFGDGSVFVPCDGLEVDNTYRTVKGDLDGNAFEDSISYIFGSNILSYYLCEGNFIKGSNFIQTGGVKSV